MPHTLVTDWTHARHAICSHWETRRNGLENIVGALWEYQYRLGRAHGTGEALDGDENRLLP